MKWSIPEKVIARGRQYLQEGRVLSVVPDQEENVWHAEVLGSELKERVLQQIRIDTEGSGQSKIRYQLG